MLSEVNKAFSRFSLVEGNCSYVTMTCERENSNSECFPTPCTFDNTKVKGVLT
jgi:hypothetical protein